MEDLTGLRNSVIVENLLMFFSVDVGLCCSPGEEDDSCVGNFLVALLTEVWVLLVVVAC